MLRNASNVWVLGILGAAKYRKHCYIFAPTPASTVMAASVSTPMPSGGGDIRSHIPSSRTSRGGLTPL